MLAGDVGSVGEKVVLGMGSCVINKDVGICGHARYGADHVAVFGDEGVSTLELVEGEGTMIRDILI